MNDNWWTMQKLIEGRERELRVRMEQIKPWIRERAGGPGRFETLSGERCWPGAAPLPRMLVRQDAGENS
jgi:hypothetical protein